jgi:RHS repeat-associated protein
VYDSWGKLVSITGGSGENVTDNTSHIGYINPLRYRSYYYDTETGLYYLNARYYDPETGRFISSDDNLIGGLNLFAYCHNNPINNFDPEGMYDRNAAKEYAKKWSESRNTEYYDYSSDCANFVSQCLLAGGFKMDDNWHSYKKERWAVDIRRIGSVMKGNRNQDFDWDISENWRLATKQYSHFKNSDLTSGEVIINEKDNMANVIKNNNIQIGDIMYFKFDQAKPHHATMITKIENDMIYYSAHTNNANDKALSEFFVGSPNGVAYVLKIK